MANENRSDTLKSTLEILQDGKAVSGLWNCHASGLHSLVLRDRNGLTFDRLVTVLGIEL